MNSKCTRDISVVSVEALLEWWLPRIRPILNSKIESVMLFGSVTLGDFMPGWSDVDVCVVLDKPISDSEAVQIGGVHDDMRERFIRGRKNNWKSGQVIEGPYIPVDLATNPGKTDFCYIAGGTTRKLANCNPISPFDRYMLSHYGCCYFGRSISFPPPKRESLICQLHKDLSQLDEPGEYHLNSSIWLAGITHWIARSIVFWRDGMMLSKTAALEHEIEAGSPFAESYRLSLRLRKEGSASTGHYLHELRECFLNIVEPAAALLKQFVDG